MEMNSVAQQDLNHELIGIAHLAYEHHYSQALEACQSLVQRKPEFVMGHFLLARLLIACGKWHEGLARFDLIRGHDIFGGPRVSPRPLWNREELQGKSILLACEGGLGDATCFARFVKPFSDLGAKVVWAGYEPMFELLKSVPGMQFMVDLSVVDKVYFDYWLPILSCPRLLNMPYHEINGSPFVSCPTEARLRLTSLMQTEKPKVGLCWQGNADFVEDNLRSIPGELMRPLVQLTDFSFFTLNAKNHKTPFEHENLRDLGFAITNPSDLAGYLSHLDLLISVDSGPAHLAGALGVPTLLLNRVMGWFTFAHQPVLGQPQTTPFYQSMHILHQLTYGQWESTIDLAVRYVQERKWLGKKGF